MLFGKLLATLAMVGALAFALPAHAGHFHGGHCGSYGQSIGYSSGFAVVATPYVPQVAVSLPVQVYAPPVVSVVQPTVSYAPVAPVVAVAAPVYVPSPVVFATAVDYGFSGYAFGSGYGFNRGYGHNFNHAGFSHGAARGGHR